MSRFAVIGVALFVILGTVVDVYQIGTSTVNLERHMPFFVQAVVAAIFLTWRWMERRADEGLVRVRQEMLLKRVAQHPHTPHRTTRADEGWIE